MKNPLILSRSGTNNLKHQSVKFTTMALGLFWLFMTPRSYVQAGPVDYISVVSSAIQNDKGISESDLTAAVNDMSTSIAAMNCNNSSQYDKLEPLFQILSALISRNLVSNADMRAKTFALKTQSEVLRNCLTSSNNNTVQVYDPKKAESNSLPSSQGDAIGSTEALNNVFVATRTFVSSDGTSPSKSVNTPTPIATPSGTTTPPSPSNNLVENSTPAPSSDISNEPNQNPNNSESTDSSAPPLGPIDSLLSYCDSASTDEMIEKTGCPSNFPELSNDTSSEYADYINSENPDTVTFDPVPLPTTEPFNITENEWWSDPGTRMCLRSTPVSDPVEVTASMIRFRNFSDKIVSTGLYAIDTKILTQYASLTTGQSFADDSQKNLAEDLCRQISKGQMLGVTKQIASYDGFLQETTRPVSRVQYSQFYYSGKDGFLLACHEVCPCAMSASLMPKAVDQMPDSSFFIAEKIYIAPVCTDTMNFMTLRYGDQLPQNVTVNIGSAPTLALIRDLQTGLPISADGYYGKFRNYYAQMETWANNRRLSACNAKYQFEFVPDSDGHRSFVGWDNLKIWSQSNDPNIPQVVTDEYSCPCAGSTNPTCTFTADPTKRYGCDVKWRCDGAKYFYNTNSNVIYCADKYPTWPQMGTWNGAQWVSAWTPVP